MQTGQPSRTALRVAAHRAVHQILESGEIFTDPFARTILGHDADSLIAEAASNQSMRQMRLIFAARSRFAEDSLRAAVMRGVRQAVILGAGLDTFAFRNPYASEGLHVFEVDHPATQKWKRERMREVGISPPGSLTFVPVDFGVDVLDPCLVKAGFDPDAPAFFHWLGVSMYLPRESVFSVLRFVARLPNSEIVFDYSEPVESYAPERRKFITAAIANAAASGEPWLSYFKPEDLATALDALGFSEREDLVYGDISSRYPGAGTQGSGNDPGPHIVRARKP